MKKLLSALGISAVVFLALAARDVCDNMLFFSEGATSTTTSYNEDGKLTGSVKSTFTKVGKVTGGTSVTVHAEYFDKKGKSNNTGDYTITCKSGVLYFDMKAMMPQQNQNASADMEMVLEGVDMEYPSKLEVGGTLKDANIKVSYKMKSNGTPVPMMNIEVRVFNRKVEAKESITTPAGTYECYKISEEVETKTMFKIKAKSVNWFSYQVGNVRTESYKDNGKMTGYSELTEFKK